MKSNIYLLQQFCTDFRKIPAEAEKVANYNNLDEKSALRLRLLAEELICMLPPLLIYGEGSFWIENDGNDYELHLYVQPKDPVDFDVNKLLSLSSTGKNAEAKGIIHRLTVALQLMMKKRAKQAKDDPYGSFKAGVSDYDENQIWSLVDYKNGLNSEVSEPEQKEQWDELEKSIIANLADDVTVGIIGGKIHIVVKKSF